MKRTLRRAVHCLKPWEKVMLTGGPGCGQHTKMANQIAIAGTCGSAVAEAIRLRRGEAAWIRVQHAWTAIGKGAAGSWQMSNNGAENGEGRLGARLSTSSISLRICALPWRKRHQRRARNCPCSSSVLNIYEQPAGTGAGRPGNPGHYQGLPVRTQRKSAAPERPGCRAFQIKPGERTA